jgi:uncharacterized protein (DUF58 family)
MFRMSEQALNLEATWIKRVERWVERKRPSDKGELELNRKRIYILPTRAGLMFSVILMIMGLTAINYKLSLGYALVFLLGGMAWTSMFNTFGNLHRLVLLPGRADSVFAGELAPISLTIKNPNRREHFSIRLVSPEFVKQAMIDLMPESERTLRFALKTTKRGWMPLPRLTVDTVFPIGIWRAWSRWQPDINILVYPEPEAGNLPLPDSLATGAETFGHSNGQDDIAALRNYREGDSPRMIAWRAVARSPGDELITKQFDGGASGELSFDWSNTPVTLGKEGRISRLTRWVVDAEKAGIKFALNIPGTQINSDNGPVHLKNCLTALALLEV